MSLLSEAERDLSRLAAIAGAFPFPKLLVQPFLRNVTTGGDAVVTYTGTYADVEASAKVKFTSAAGTISIGARLGSYSGGVPAAGYVAEISNTGLVKLWRLSDWSELGSYQIANYQSGTFTTLLISANGNALRVDVDGTTRISTADNTFTSGAVGLWSYGATAANQHVIDDFNLVVLGHAGGAQSGGSLPDGSLAAWWEGVKAWFGGGKLAAPAALKSQMAIRQRELTLTDTLGAPVEVPPTGQVYRNYYFVGSVRVAMREFTGSVSVVSYILTDHLGSTSMILDASGIPVSTTLYKPWGETRYSSGAASTDYKYTGQLSLDIGIYHYGARLYDPMIGRFLSADSIVPGAGNPQAWDRYAYGLNSPVRYVDPTGHSACDGPNGGDPDCPAYEDINRRKSSSSSSTGSPSTNDNQSSNNDRSPSSPPSTLGPQEPPRYEPYKPEVNPNEDLITLLKLFQINGDLTDALTWMINNGRPVYKQVKGLVPGGPAAEGIAGAGLQFLNDLQNSNYNYGQRLVKAGLVGIEDGITDSIPTPLGSVTGITFATGVGLITSGTGPIAIAAHEVSGIAGFMIGSYAATTLIDNSVWAPFNSKFLPQLFP